MLSPISMRCRTYHLVSAAVFAVVALLHLARVLRAIPVHAGDWEVPMGISWAGIFGAALLAGWAFFSRPAA